jgi:NAD(P)-dependent dehydrogenase (short-subunit alcohol dehydrogenase family)
MDIRGKVAIVTGGASGIGAGLAQRFAAEGARAVVVADLNLERAQGVAQAIGASALALKCDVSVEADIQALVGETRKRFGQVDIYFSNAGILGKPGGIELEDALWEKMWQVHGMAHVWAARAVVPEMVERGEGYFLVTASAAGLLNIVESAPYGVTKHAALAFAEWLRIAYGRRGVRVSCLCPQSVESDMTRNGAGSAGLNGVLTPAQVGEEVVRVMREESFLVLPHPEVAKYFLAKAQDYDRWLGGMQKLYAQHMGAKPA